MNGTRRRSLITFLGLTFLISWSVWIPLALDHFSLLPTSLSQNVVMLGILIGTWGPAISAFLVTALNGRSPAVMALLSQLKRWRVKWTWYAAVLLVFPTLGVITAAIYRILSGGQALPTQPISTAGLVTTSIVMLISVTGEEIGWRGFALPHMQQRWTALKASLVLGTIQTIWHLPFWTVLGEYERYGLGYWFLGWALVLAFTIYITWVMNNTGNCLFLVFLFHWSWNIFINSFLPITSVVPAYLILVVIAWVFALGLIAYYGPTRLVRANKIASLSNQNI